MKKIIIALLLCFSFSSAFTQTYYKVTTTEMHTYNSKTAGWDLYSKNSNTNIEVVVEDEFITIEANSPTMFKIYSVTKQELTTETLTGYSYEARDLKRDKMIRLDVVKSRKNDGVALISVVNREEGYNLRYYLITNN
jgi:hypothetical protein